MVAKQNKAKGRDGVCPMTTIAYRDGVIAADTSSWDANGIYFWQSRKLVALDDGRVFGAAGSYSMALRVSEWLNGKADTPECDSNNPTDCVEAIVVSPDGIVTYMDQSLTEMPVSCEFTAIGSGRELALGAMAMGATAEQAVAVACGYDHGSRGPIETIVVVKRHATDQAGDPGWRAYQARSF